MLVLLVWGPHLEWRGLRRCESEVDRSVGSCRGRKSQPWGYVEGALELLCLRKPHLHTELGAAGEQVAIPVPQTQAPCELTTGSGSEALPCCVWVVVAW